MVKRQVPDARALFDLVKFKKPVFDAKKRRLANALTIDSATGRVSAASEAGAKCVVEI